MSELTKLVIYLPIILCNSNEGADFSFNVSVFLLLIIKDLLFFLSELCHNVFCLQY